MNSVLHWTRHFKSAVASSQTVMAVLSTAVVGWRCPEAQHSWRAFYWSPKTTLVALLFQTLNGCKALRAALAEVLDVVHSCGVGPAAELPSADPSAFCAARRRLPASVIEAILKETTRRIVELLGEPLRSQRRRVWIVDGSFATMADGPQLQEAFP